MMPPRSEYRNSGLGRTAIVLKAGLAICAVQFVVVSICNVTHIETLSTRPSQEVPSLAQPKALLDEPLPCARVSEDVRYSRVMPVQKLLARYTNTTPPFWISSHDSAFDEKRWEIIELGEYYETALTNIASDTLRHAKPGLVIDVGANVGWLSLVAASFGHRVMSFEPNPANQMRLCQSMLLNGWASRIDVFPNGVSDFAGNMTLKWDGNPGGAKLRVDEASSDDHEAVNKVQVVTLDEIAEAEGVFEDETTIHLLKVDVEGFEPQVFRGAAKLLSSGLVRSIFHEVTVRRDEEKHRNLLSMMRQLLNAGFEPREFVGLASSSETINVTFSSTSGDEELDAFLSKCRRNPWGQCDLLWNYRTVNE